jgi:hypothetical protein
MQPLKIRTEGNDWPTVCPDVLHSGDDQQYDREVAFIAAAAEANLDAVIRVSTANMLISLTTTCVYARAHAR